MATIKKDRELVPSPGPAFKANPKYHPYRGQPVPTTHPWRRAASERLDGTPFQKFKTHRDRCSTCRHADLTGPFCAEGLELWQLWLDDVERAAVKP
jgi:hypothetical protein